MTGAVGRVLAGLLVGCVALTGCAGVPGGGEVNDVAQVANPDNRDEAVAPSPGQPQDAIVRGFLQASARGGAGNEYAAARQHLTPDTQHEWPPESGEIMILANNPRLTIEADKPNQVQMVGTQIGVLDQLDAYHSRPAEYRRTLTMAQVAGEWRIKDPPPTIVVQQSDFSQYFEPRTVYFLDPSRTVLVPDQRYVDSPPEQRPGRLMNLLLTGPGGVLRNSASTELAGARLRTNVSVEDGLARVDLRSIRPPTPAARRALAAQVVYSLASDVARVSITIDGQPLEADDTVYVPSDFLSFDPDRVPSGTEALAQPVFVDADGNLARLTDGVPVLEQTAGFRRQSAAVSQTTGSIAVVSQIPSGQFVLAIGTADGSGLHGVLTSTNMTAPSFSRSGNEVWVAQNGSDGTPVIIQVSAAVSGEQASSRVGIEASVLTGHGPISAFVVSPDGVRVAVIADHKLYLAALSTRPDDILSEPSNGQDSSTPLTLVNLTPIATDLTDIYAVVFYRSTELLVAGRVTGAEYRTISRIAIDGSDRKPVTSREITSDVDAVAGRSSAQNQVYATFGGRVYVLEGSLTDGVWTTPQFATSLLNGSSPAVPN